ncbi:LysM peptidoglycan-binding domain-containing protein [Paenarthrobacter sp. YJN-5]|uniref:LysM peptidoglycan-binding domain-containing protein n=1 Tax=Paenarthrobacter sp. YJN-5 TaxID=2735316 RepID=UPI001877BC93|nr:LysM peptidoglycan-binding domain-containing protein [Paenarthrobacter sp. YJN-5]QOT19380.1 LysM peptidoglycan-binding domain-containing protein [Paenarthrobacter sp. YJN-5]
MSKSVRRLSTAVTAGAALSAVALSTLISGTAAHAAAPAAYHAPMQVSASGTYTVRPGDTLSGIAARHGISLAAIFAAYGMDMHTIIYPGQIINVGPAAQAPSNPAPAAPANTTPASVILKAGDTLSAIAARNGVSLAAVLAANNLQMRSIIYPGQKILLATSAAAPAAPAAPTTIAPAVTSITPAAGTTYVVKPGDTLSKIAAAYGVSLSSVLTGNGMTLNTIIYPGQRITVGAAAPAAPAAPVNTPAPAAAPAPATSGSPSSAQLKTMVADTARRMGVDPSLALAFAMQESGFRQNVTSSAGAIGTMQVMPTSGEWASQLVGRPLDLRNAQDNITAGVAIIASLVHTSPSTEIAIASYYQGQYSVMHRGMYEDTKAYVASVLKYQQSFR